MMLRDDQPDPLKGDRTNPRLNLLLSYSGWREQSCVDQLPRLLSPMGIQSIRVDSGEEAEQVIRTYRVHIAVVDLAIPLLKAAPEDNPPATPPIPSTRGGARMLQLLRRLDEQPPVVVIRPADPSLRENTRSLGQSLREGVFAVLDQPVAIEDMLEVMRRILRRHYADVWPS